ncbi:MAG: type 2 isopentenyl-diphosphate Delta-isomerase, partial [Flexilinea flocculi]|nr:type 2 isopentenyl-diphosphate Delta-isomerase [Flexilinea flocculi]
MTINSRKDNHIAVCLKKNVQSESTNGFEKYRLVHNALPERNFEDIKTETVFLNQKIAAPILISSITGGTESGNRINRSLLEAANTLNIPFAMGSMRILLEEDSHGIYENPRKFAPNIPVLANVGAVQFNYGFSRDQCLRAIELIEANALILHLNPLQEVLQSSRNTNFSGLLKKIDHLCSNFPVPIIVKEVGWGISDVVAKNLIDAGVQIIDVAGAGGTSWAKVEAEISGTETAERLASPFFSWGIPTAQCIEQIHARFPN